MKSSFSIYNSK